LYFVVLENKADWGTLDLLLFVALDNKPPGVTLLWALLLLPLANRRLVGLILT
jgi:hypothetical protein